MIGFLTGKFYCCPASLIFLPYPVLTGCHLRGYVNKAAVRPSRTNPLLLLFGGALNSPPALNIVVQDTLEVTLPVHIVTLWGTQTVFLMLRIKWYSYPIKWINTWAPGAATVCPVSEHKLQLISHSKHQFEWFSFFSLFLLATLWWRPGWPFSTEIKCDSVITWNLITHTACVQQGRFSPFLTFLAVKPRRGRVTCARLAQVHVLSFPFRPFFLL